MARPSSFLARKPHDSSPRGVDLAARDLWKLTAIVIVVNAVLAVGTYWVFSFIRIGPLQLLFIWFPLYLCATLPPPHRTEGAPILGHHVPFRGRLHRHSGQPPVHSRSSRPDSCSTLSRAGRWPRVSRPDSPSMPRYNVFAAASMAFLECTRNPGKDLVIALTDKQKTTLTPRGNLLPLPGATVRRGKLKQPGCHHPVEG